MLNLGSFMKKGAAEKTAAELGEALRLAEADRQSLREREQALSVSRQDVLLDGSDEDLDAIEAELTSIARQAERHDIRIPELRRLYGERQSAEERKAFEEAFSAAMAKRVELASRIDAAFADLGKLFDALEEPAETLRGLNGYHRASSLISGPMSEWRLDREALKSAVLLHAPRLARAFGWEATIGREKQSYRAHEVAVRDRLNASLVLRPSAPPAQPATADEADAAELSRRIAARID